MNKTLLVILGVIAALILIFPYFGFSNSSQIRPQEYIQQDTRSFPTNKENASSRDKNKLSEIEDLLNN